MDRLDRNWLTDGLIDFEYKKYVLLSYLCHVENQFSAKKLYPKWPELNEHYVDLLTYKTRKTSMNAKLPKTVRRIDLEECRIQYETTGLENSSLLDLDDIVDYGLGSLKEKLGLGEELIQFVMDRITIEPVGICPLNKNFGYLFFCSTQSKTVEIYQYQVSPVKGLKDNNDTLKTYHIQQERLSIANSMEEIRRKLLKVNKNLPNPATYSIISKERIPHQETLLPVAKSLLIEQLAA